MRLLISSLLLACGAGVLAQDADRTSIHDRIRTFADEAAATLGDGESEAGLNEPRANYLLIAAQAASLAGELRHAGCCA